jgi:uncharacterized damage-inducible protein DinB
MNPVAVWFERKFEFGFLDALLPNLCARLRGTPARLEEMTRERPPQLMLRQPGKKWSAQEHAGHLSDLEPLWIARVGDFVAGAKQLTVADLSNRKTDEADHNARKIEAILTDFRDRRSQLLERVEQLKPEAFRQTILHPRLQQPMRVVDHLYFVAEHDDHHLARIWEIISAG